MSKSISRFLPAWLSAGFRRALVSFEYRTGLVVWQRDSLEPPAWLHDVGGCHFEVGEEFFRYFTDLAGLKPHERVLDVGCGTGRMARPLTNYLTSGSYDGLDIVAPSIAWCKKAYAGFRNFRFHFANIHNLSYNPSGTSLASEYRFPFPDSSFDFVLLASVFTHMLPADLENYLREIARILKPDGRCLISYFLLNAVSLKLISENASAIQFKGELPGCRVDNLEMPEGAVAYDENRVRDLYEKYGLRILEPLRYGAWCGRKDGLSFQDLIVGSKLAN